MDAIVSITELPLVGIPLKVYRVSFGQTARATAHPVELGVDISDHVEVSQFTFTLHGLVDASPQYNPTSPFIVQQAQEFFLKAAGKLLTVKIENVGLFSQCVMESWPHTIDQRSSLPVSIRFRQLAIVTPVTVLIPPRVPLPGFGGVSTDADLGNQAAVERSVGALFLDIGASVARSTAELLGF